MKKLAFSIAFFALASIIFYACKEEEVSNQQFVQNHIIGKWPLKRSISIIKKNGIETENDTLIYGKDSTSLPIDTVQFLADGTFIRNKDDSFKYAVDGEGNRIIFSRDSIGTWFIKFLRRQSIILTQERTENTGSDTFIYYKEQQLIK
ncbi:MAG: hypothetical protein ACQUHE_01400 [Bacteroidia bacterium]